MGWSVGVNHLGGPKIGLNNTVEFLPHKQRRVLQYQLTLAKGQQYNWILHPILLIYEQKQQKK